MAAAGLEAEVLDSGCCGLAGNFGFEEGHYDVSIACAERVLLPRLRDAPEETVFLADGFSCRTQVEQARTGRRGVHLAEALAAGVRGADRPQGQPEQESAVRPPAPPTLRRVVTGGVTTAIAVAISSARRRRRRG
jgi:hypothetical protein